MIRVFGRVFKNEFKPKLPEEDSFKFSRDKDAFAVADGITRDPEDFSRFEQTYPNPSPAKTAADIVCSNFLKSMKGRKRSLNSVVYSLNKANMKLKKWNKKHFSKPDYLEKDLAGCVACAGCSDKNLNLFYAYNSDCGLAVFNEESKRIFITDDLMMKISKYMYEKNKKYCWDNPDERARIRKEFRNRLRSINGNIASYGAFTGEKEAMSKHLLKKGKLNLKHGYKIVLFSDGAREYFASGKKDAEKILMEKGIRGLVNYLKSGKHDKRERTILAVEVLQ